MAKQKLTFEGLVTGTVSGDQGYASLALPGVQGYGGFQWNFDARVVEDSFPAWNQVHATSGTAALYPIPRSAPEVAFGTADGSSFSFRKFKLIDVNGDNAGTNIAVYGYRDGVQVAFDQPFILGDTTTVKLSSAFKDVDRVQIYTNGKSVAYDDLLVKLPVAPALDDHPLA